MSSAILDEVQGEVTAPNFGLGLNETLPGEENCAAVGRHWLFFIIYVKIMIPLCGMETVLPVSLPPHNNRTGNCDECRQVY